MQKRGSMFYVSALIAVTGAVGYQYLVKRVPVDLNPIVSILGIYVGVMILTVASLPLFPSEGGLMAQMRQLNWIQIGLAVSVFMIEFGFLFMYRSGWNLGTGNLVTGVVINIALVAIGVLALGEKITPVNVLGIVLCIAGVALIGFRSE